MENIMINRMNFEVPIFWDHRSAAALVPNFREHHASMQKSHLNMSCASAMSDILRDCYYEIFSEFLRFIQMTSFFFESGCVSTARPWRSILICFFSDGILRLVPWWLRYWNPEVHLIGALELEHDFYDFPYIGNVIIPTDEHIFQRGRSTTNLPCHDMSWYVIVINVCEIPIRCAISRVSPSGSSDPRQGADEADEARSISKFWDPSWDSLGSSQQSSIDHPILGCWVPWPKVGTRKSEANV